MVLRLKAFVGICKPSRGPLNLIVERLNVEDESKREASQSHFDWNQHQVFDTFSLAYIYLTCKVRLDAVQEVAEFNDGKLTR